MLVWEGHVVSMPEAISWEVRPAASVTASPSCLSSASTGSMAARYSFVSFLACRYTNEVRMQTSRSGGHKRQKTDIARKDWPRAGPQGSKAVRERLLVCVKTPRSHTNEVDEYEAIVTSELHAQADRAKKLTREEKAASSGGSDKDPEPEDGA